MIPEELMIGDWVNVILHNKPVRITCNFGTMVGTNVIQPLRQDEIEPIPLTREILEANGFKKTDSEYYWRSDKDSDINVNVRIITDYFTRLEKATVQVTGDSNRCCGINQVHSNDIKYVHQLQHALRLCGIDKEIQL